MMSATGRDELPDAKLILKLLRIGRLRDKGHCQLANGRTNVGNDASQHSRSGNFSKRLSQWN